jgi:hypothetical protein
MLGSTLELLFSIAITADVSVKREHFLEPLLPGNQADYSNTHSLLAEGRFVISTDQDLEHKTGKTIHISQAHYLLCCIPKWILCSLIADTNIGFTLEPLQSLRDFLRQELDRRLGGTLIL